MILLGSGVLEGLGVQGVIFRGLGILCVLGFCKRTDNVQFVPPRNVHLVVVVVVGKRLQLGLLGMLLQIVSERERENNLPRVLFLQSTNVVFIIISTGIDVCKS